MTWGIRNVIGVLSLYKGKDAPRGLIFSNYDSWPYWKQKLYDYAFGCHYAHLLEFCCALICWLYLFPRTFPEAHELKVSWIAKVVLYNLTCEFLCYGTWHYLVYGSKYSTSKKLKEKKYNQQNQYEENKPAGFIFSSTGHLQREVLFTTLGFLQSSAYQCVMMHLWATGRVPFYTNFWAYPLYSMIILLAITYWREFHFYWVHRFMHPWWNGKYGLAQGDIGAFMYRWVHSLHHKSYNPGPWSGLSMHPVEHFLYYTCTLFPLLFTCHPLHFLYAKFHADIAPIGGHDGFADPGGDSAFHYLHHSKAECNYGVPLVNFDVLFGTYVDWSEYVKAGKSLTAMKQAKNLKKST